MATIGDRLAAARRAARLTQEQLASRIGVTRPAISQWERGIMRVEDKHHANLSRVLNVPMSTWNPYGATDYPLDEHAPRLILAVILLSKTAEGDGGNVVIRDGIGRRSTSHPDAQDGDVFVRVEDDAMALDGRGLQPGDEVLIARNVQPEHDDIVLAEIETSPPTYLLRRYVERGAEAYDLQPDNPIFETYTVAGPRKAQIIGTAVEFVTRRRPRS